jgi:hypothetical protein
MFGPPSRLLEKTMVIPKLYLVAPMPLLDPLERRGPPMLKLPTTTPLLLVFLPTTGVMTKVTGGNNKGKPVKFEFVTSARQKVRGRVLLNFWERRGPPMLKLPTTTLLLAMTKVMMTKAIRGGSRATEGRKQGPMPINPKTEKINEGTKLSTMAISPAVGRSDRQGKSKYPCYHKYTMINFNIFKLNVSDH